MKISEVQKFLYQVEHSEGDLDVEAITGFWVRTRKHDGKRLVIPVIGRGQSVRDALENGVRILPIDYEEPEELALGESRPSPKEHPFTPVKPESTLCRWCMFAEKAHVKTTEE